MANGFKVADAYVEIHADKDTLKREIAALPEGGVGTEAERAGTQLGKRVGKGLSTESSKQGKDSGDKLSKGMELALVRNSPLIAAAIGGALAAGAPVAIAGAAALFAGIGVVAAAQSERVQSAWVGLWNNLKSGTQADASVLEGTVAAMAGQINNSFQSLRPQLRSIFADSEPYITTFVTSLTDAAHNAMPGFTAAVHNAGPVVAGLGSLIANTGTGLGEFFSIISEHAPAAGVAFDAIGRIVASLLPILGQFMGTGAELASVILPPLASILEVIAGVLGKLQPILPVVALGFGAFKIASSVTGWLKALSNDGLGGLLGKIPGVSTGMQNIASKMGLAGSSGAALAGTITGVLGVGITLLGAIAQQSQERITNWTSALNEGGSAAARARDEMAQFQGRADAVNDSSAGLGLRLQGLGGVLDSIADDADQAAEAHKRWWQSLSPLEQAQSKVAEWTKILSDRLGDENATTAEVEAAKRRLAYWADQETQAQNDLELATKGVTQAMIDQANQAMAQIDASFAYQNSLDQLKDDEVALAEAIRDHGSASDEAGDASRQYAEDLWQTAQNAGRLKAEQSGLSEDSAEYARVIQNETLQALYNLRQGLGPEMQAAVDTMIHTLEAGGASLDEIGQYHPVPTVGVNTGPLDTGIQGALGHLFNLSQQHPVPIADLNTNPFAGKHATAMAQIATIANQRPTPVVGANTSPFAAQADWAMGRLGQIGSSRPSPIITAYAQTAAAENAINYAARSRTATINVIGKGAIATGGKAGDFAPGFTSGGKLFGPGGPTDDQIPASVIGQGNIRVSPKEWIINAKASQEYGDATMAAVNAGIARISVPGRGGEGGGSGGGNTYQVTVQLNGMFDFTKPDTMRQFGIRLKETLRRLDKEGK